MPFNFPGVLAPFQVIFRPRLIIPSLTISDIRTLNFAALYEAGYRGAVFDKDNCLTLPHEDYLVPDLKEAWDECKSVFGKGNVIVVSNTAGTSYDDGGIQAESVSHHLGVLVLRHASLKPSYSCAQSIRKYFSSLPEPIPDSRLIVVGDRIFTDVVLANRMRPYHLTSRENDKPTFAPLTEGPLGIFVNRVWKRENTLIRGVEKGLVKLVEKWTIPPKSTEFETRKKLHDMFVHPVEMQS